MLHYAIIQLYRHAEAAAEHEAKMK